MRRLVSTALSLLLSLAALMPARAFAQGVSDLPSTTGDSPGGLSPAIGYWRGSGKARWFFSSRFDLGVFYLSPRAAVGYGKPHYEWFGAEGSVSSSTNGGRWYGGLRLQLPRLRIRGGARYDFDFTRHFLPIQSSYDREELDQTYLEPSAWPTIEGEVVTNVPIAHGQVFALAAIYHQPGLPAGRAFFDTATRTITVPPWLGRLRAGVSHPVDRDGQFRIGGDVEGIWDPNRESLVVRTGPTLSVTLTHHLEMVAAAMFAVASPDTLGIAGADVGRLGLRYRFATGDRYPEFP